ncbi:MAG TPA: DUF2059 domain-containing protein [Kiritimatiellia bacterium]|nr:DUF2059 domain-containing protein [Kiritimatiellia bacterium]HQQ04770.1 DUF2059 domain-containing protein [Kiritimatiellia bacterium]
MKTTFAMLVISLMLSAATVRAEEETAQTLAEELLVLMDVQSSIQKSFDAVKQMQATQFASMAGDRKEQALAMQQKMMDLIAGEMSWDKIKTDYIGIYAETFTADELKGIIDFYKTPVGRKFIEKQPEMMEKSMRVTQKQMMTLMPKIQALALEAAGMPPARPAQ